MGLTERKVMFLTKTMNLSIGKHGDIAKGQIIILDPLNTTNIGSLGALPSSGDDARIYNWDKLCILGIYIKFQPKKNMWDANGNDNITPVKCIYSSHIIPVGNTPAINAASLAIENSFVNNKQVFTFNSNEAFTMYIPAPTTMSSEDPCVHKSKTWWSLYNIGKHTSSNNIQGTQNDQIEEEDYDDDDELAEYSAITGATRPYVSAGVLFLTVDNDTDVADYNITINYKVALKG